MTSIEQSKNKAYLYIATLYNLSSLLNIINFEYLNRLYETTKTIRLMNYLSQLIVLVQYCLSLKFFFVCTIDPQHVSIIFP